MTRIANKQRLRPGRVRDSGVDRLFMACVYLLLATFLAVVLLPLMYRGVSFSSPNAVSSGRVWLWPVDFSIRGYEVALGNPQIVTGFANSLFYTASARSSASFSRSPSPIRSPARDFYGRNVITAFIVFTMIFAGRLIPTYLVVQKLGLLDTRLALIVPGAIGVCAGHHRPRLPAQQHSRLAVRGRRDRRCEQPACSGRWCRWPSP